MLWRAVTAKELSVILLQGLARILFGGAILVGGLVGMSGSPLAGHVPGFNAEIFEESIRKAVDGKVMGYSFVIADRNGIRVKISGGYAQAPSDGNLRMKTYIPSNIGSVAKVMTGIALLNLLEQRKVADLTVEQQLNTPMRFFLPDKWVRHYKGVNLERITLRNLLNHRSGLGPEPGSGGPEGTKIALALSQGANPSRIGRGKHDYNNNNYTLLLYIIPAIVYRSEVDGIERRNAELPLPDYSKKIAREYGALYERYMREVFLPRTIERIAPTCRPGRDIHNGRYAKEYDSRSDTRGRVVNADFCRSQGAWFYSAQDLTRFAQTFEFTNRYISRATRRMLFDPNRLDERLVFNKTVTNSGFQSEAGQSVFPRHGGSSPDGSRAALVRLPFRYIGVGATNSREISSGTLSKIILDAFLDATRITPEYNTDRGGSNYKNVDLGRADPALCQARCNGEVRCKAWTYVKAGVQGPKARCWLKTGAPAAKASACCVSGLK